MKKVLLIAFLLTLAMGTAIAQNKGGGQGQGGKGQPGNSFSGNAYGGNQGNPVDRLTEELGLDETQVATIEAIFEENQLLREEERERSRQANCDLRADTHTQILAVLTPDQVDLFDEMQQNRQALRQAIEEMRQYHGGGAGGFGGGRGPGDCDN